MFATKGEYRNDNTCRSPRVLCQAQVTTMQDEDVAIGEFTIISVDGIDGNTLCANRDNAVVALFPFQQFVCLGVYHYIFILYRQQPALCIDGQEPFTLTSIIHLQITAGAPRADGRMTATDGYSLSLLQLGSRYAEHHRPAKQRQRQRFGTFSVRTSYRSEIGCGIEVHG